MIPIRETLLYAISFYLQAKGGKNQSQHRSHGREDGIQRESGENMAAGAGHVADRQL